jgi:superfamily II DNA or RNA helicase
VSGGRRLRAWQEAALSLYQASAPRDFLVTATPGAGKTTFALALATNLLAARVVDRVIVVCPTDRLRTQWAEAASHAGVTLDPTLSNSVGPVTDDFDGYVTTYAQVASKPLLHRRRAEVKRTLVLLDEVHHAGDGLSWGEAIFDAFEDARRRVCLTGTPFRTKPDERIPFVRYEDAGDGSLASVADFEYGYREALRDGVVRPVVFAAYSGVARWMNSAGDVIASSLAEPATKDEELRAWQTVLDPKGQWIPHVVAAADDRLTQIRSTGMPDAGAMLLASDQETAKAYAKIVERVTGHKPVLVLSEDSKASDKIDAFAAGTDRWLVAVRLVSEGVDVPRLACGVWGTSYRTPLFFAQAVGRFVRSRRPGETATVFLPAVRPLLALAAELESERNHILTVPSGEHDLLDPVPTDETVSEHGGWEALDAEAEFAHVLAGGTAVVAADDPYADMDADDADFLGLPGLLDPKQTAALLARRDVEARKKAEAARRTEDGNGLTAVGTPQRTAWQEAAALRREINSLVSRVSARTGRPHAQIHADVRKAVPGPPSATATLEQLRGRRDWLMSR